MTRESEGKTGGITRRTALKAGAAATALALGGTAIGTAEKPRTAESENIVPVHHFVRAADDSDPGGPFFDPVSPKPDDDDPLVSRIEGAPVDDGTAPETVDGELGQLTWGQFRDVEGRIRLKCIEKGTHVSMHLSGLVPKGLYTVWVVAFEKPGFNAQERALFPALKNVVGSAPLGDNDGGENVFRASASGEGQVTAIDESAIFTGPAFIDPDTSERCLLDHYEVHFIGALHIDGQTHGPNPRPYGVEHFGFVAVDGELV